jgi:hypothetical protein
VDVETSSAAALAESVAEAVPRGMRGLAGPGDPVDLLKGDDTAWTYQRRQLCHDSLWIGHVNKQEPGVGLRDRRAGP